MDTPPIATSTYILFLQNQLQFVKPLEVFNNHLSIMSKCQKSKDLVVISKLCCQKLKHACSLLELLAPLHCFDSMYSLQSLMYKTQDYNMEFHCNGDWLVGSLD